MVFLPGFNSNKNHNKGKIMQAKLDCIPCFYKQALRAARLSGNDGEIQREVLNQLSVLTPEFQLSSPPAEIGRTVFSMISKVTGKKDPYKEIKEESNRVALKIYSEMKRIISESGDQFLTALQLAVIGNSIGFGLKDLKDISEKIDLLIDSNFHLHTGRFEGHFNYNSFCQRLSEVQSILYLADSAGEVVFDLVFIEQLVANFQKNVIYVVKGKPVLIDALVEDAIYCGINKIANITSCGADCPGVVLEYCSPEFIRLFNDAEMIISKGQGNYGALSDEPNPIFFLLIAKCPVIAQHIGCNIGDYVLKDNSKERELLIEIGEDK